MADEEIREEEPAPAAGEGVIPGAEPADSAAGSSPPIDVLDGLLAEYDAGIRDLQPTVDLQPPGPEEQDQQGRELLDQILRETDEQVRQQELAGKELDWATREARLDSELSKRDQHIRLVEQQNQELRYREWQQAEQRDYDAYAQKIQSRLPDGVEEDFAHAQLMLARATDPSLAIAWDNRSANPAVLAAELWRLEAAMRQVQLNPAADPRLIAHLPEMQQRVQALTVAINSKQILSRLENQIVSKARARSRRGEIDHEITANYMAVAASMRDGARGRAPTHEPAPHLGSMSNQELAAYTRSNFGF
jgi:hypothetical protein